MKVGALVFLASSCLRLVALSSDGLFRTHQLKEVSFACFSSLLFVRFSTQHWVIFASCALLTFAF